MTRLRQAIDEAARVLAEASVDICARSTPSSWPRMWPAPTAAGWRCSTSLGDDFFSRYAELIAARAKRIPLQHLTGTAAFGPLNLASGPVSSFRGRKPKPFSNGRRRSSCRAEPLIVDLCTGSGALAAALARHEPAARVIGVDISAHAMAYAHRNTVGTSVELRVGDVCDSGLFDDLDGRGRSRRCQSALSA